MLPCPAAYFCTEGFIIITGYTPEAKKMAAEIEDAICQKALEGWAFVTFSVTNSCKAILVFRVP